MIAGLGCFDRRPLDARSDLFPQLWDCGHDFHLVTKTPSFPGLLAAEHAPWTRPTEKTLCAA